MELYTNAIFNIHYVLGLFGEGPADRRERLRHILAQLGADAIRKERSEALAEKKKRDEVILRDFFCNFGKGPWGLNP